MNHIERIRKLYAAAKARIAEQEELKIHKQVQERLDQMQKEKAQTPIVCEHCGRKL